MHYFCMMIDMYKWIPENMPSYRVLFEQEYHHRVASDGVRPFHILIFADCLPVQKYFVLLLDQLIPCVTVWDQLRYDIALDQHNDLPNMDYVFVYDQWLHTYGYDGPKAATRFHPNSHLFIFSDTHALVPPHIMSYLNFDHYFDLNMDPDELISRLSDRIIETEETRNITHAIF